VEKRRGGLEDLTPHFLEEKLPLSTQKALFNLKAVSQIGDSLGEGKM